MAMGGRIGMKINYGGAISQDMILIKHMSRRLPTKQLSRDFSSSKRRRDLERKSSPKQ